MQQGLTFNNFIIEYIFILLALFVVLYVFPRMLFSKFLVGKTAYYKIFFCISSMYTIICLLFVVFGVLNILDTLLIRLLFYGAFAICIFIKLFLFIKKRKFLDFKNKIKNNINDKIIAKFCQKKFLYKYFIEFLIFVLIVVFLLHFLLYSSSNYSFGFSDMAVHERWISALLEGKFFPDGLYPFGMHSVICLIVMLFGVPLHYAMLYSGPVMSIFLFIALCYWLKSVFVRKETILVCLAFLALAIFSLSTETDSLKMLYDGMHRLQWTLPQEFCLWTVFVAPVCVQNIINSKFSKKNRNKQFIIEESLLLGLCIFSSFCTHFYITLFQFVMCISVFICNVKRLNIYKFFAFVVSVSSSFVFSILLYVFMYLKNSWISSSLYWGYYIDNTNGSPVESISSVGHLGSQNIDSPGNLSQSTGMVKFFSSLQYNIINPLTHNLNSILVLVLIIASIFTLIYVFVKMRNTNQHLNYLSIFISFFILFMFYVAPAVDLPKIIDGYRLVICMYITCCAFLSITFDLFFYKTISVVMHKY